MATHPDQTLKLIKDLDKKTKDVLSKFSTKKTLCFYTQTLQ